MIRRSPTRIELKLEDLNDFEYIQKFDKKKNPSGITLPSTEVQKLVRQDRIGLSSGFRPIRASSNVGSSQDSFTSTTALVAAGGGPTSISDIGMPITPTNESNTTGGILSLPGNSVTEGLNLIIEAERAAEARNLSNMSLDESL